MDELLRNGNYNRALGTLTAGNQGNPSDTALALSNSYGNQASQAGAGAANLLGSAVHANTANNSLQQTLGQYGAPGGGGGLPDWLQAILGGGGAGSNPIAPGPQVSQTPSDQALPTGLPSGPIVQPPDPTKYPQYAAAAKSGL